MFLLFFLWVRIAPERQLTNEVIRGIKHENVLSFPSDRLAFFCFGRSRSWAQFIKLRYRSRLYFVISEPSGSFQNLGTITDRADLQSVPRIKLKTNLIKNYNFYRCSLFSFTLFVGADCTRATTNKRSNPPYQSRECFLISARSNFLYWYIIP